MGKRVARDIWVYDTMADFVVDGGVATYGDGGVEIAGEQYVVKSGRLLKIGGGSARRRLITIGCGNSIANAIKNVDINGTGHKFKAEQFLASAMCGHALEFPEIGAYGTDNSSGAGFYTDKYGWHGHGGATASTIAAEIESELFLPMLKAGVVPDMIWVHSLFENSVTTGVSVAVMLAALDLVIKLAKSYWPGVIFLIATCRPSKSVDTLEKKANYQILNATLLAMHNGVDLYVYDAGGGYEDKTLIGEPKRTLVTGSISGTTLTVESILSGERINRGAFVCIAGSTAAATQISGVGTTRGSAGIYTITNGNALSAPSGTLLEIHEYVDTVVHPTPRASMLSAIAAASAIKAIAPAFFSTNRVLSGNLLLTGSAAAAGGSITAGSTLPTNITVSGVPAGADIALAALNPGLRVTLTNFTLTGADITPITLLLNDLTLSAIGVPALDAFKHFVKFKVISGGQYLRQVNTQARTYEAGKATPQDPALDYLVTITAEGPLCYPDNMLFTQHSEVIRSPSHGSYYITNLKAYLKFIIAASTPPDAVIVIEVTRQGFESVRDKSEIAALAAGTVTIADNRIKQSSKLRVFRRNSAGTPGRIEESDRVHNTSLTITSSNAGDTSSIGYVIE